MSISGNLAHLLEQIALTARRAGRNPEEIAMIAISKERSLEEIREAYWAGCRDFGESRVQEALAKMDEAPADIRWHFIGKLQSNKVNKVVGHFVLIHSVDTIELGKKIAYASRAKGITSSILLEVNTSGEESKSGLSAKQWENAFSDLLQIEGIEILGLMTIAPLTEDESVVRHCFSSLRLLRDRLQEIGGREADLSTLSMGMTNDFPIAIQEGATLLRIGTAIFAPR